MKKQIFSLIVVVLCFHLTLLIAQNVEFEKKNFPDKKDGLKEALSNIKDADKLIEKTPPDYEHAIELYLKANDFNPNNAFLNFKIGAYYLQTIYKIKAIPFLEKVVKLNPNIDNEVFFQMAEAYHYNMQFDEAKINYQKAISQCPSEKQKEINKKIEECETGKELIKNPVRVLIDNLGPEINSKYPEYSPCISADESMIVFTSRRDNTTGGNVFDDGMFNEDIYISNKVDGKWTPAINPGKPLNSKDNDASVALSPDGQKLLIFRASGGGDIYECRLKGDKWVDPEPLRSTINTKYHETSASYSSDGKSLYFVSDRPGGFGSHDIYVSHLDEKGRWGEAENLGPVINTPYDEYGVFMHPDGKTLYFSSKGHKTMGGFDIFKSVLENGKWSEPVNLGYPINTPEDDEFLTISGSGKHGYFSSAREGGFGGQDIYMITFLGPEMDLILNTEDKLLSGVSETMKEIVIQKKVEVASNPLTILKGKILDEITKQPVIATIEMFDNEKNEKIATFESNSATGKYLVSLPSGKKYGIAVKADGYLFYSEFVDVSLSNSYQEINKDILMKKLDVGKKIVLNNIFFDYGKATLSAESTAELDRLIDLLNSNPTIKIEISGHTDNKSSREFNLKLSTNRAKAVVDYLVSKGIDMERLTYKGYGFDQPIASNNTEQGRKLNRRTEFKIISK